MKITRTFGKKLMTLNGFVSKCMPPPNVFDGKVHIIQQISPHQTVRKGGGKELGK